LTVRHNLPEDGVQADVPPPNDGGDPRPPPGGERDATDDDQSKDRGGETNNERTNQDWTKIVRWLIVEAKAHVFPYRGRRLIPSVATIVQQRGTRIIDKLLEAVDYCDAAVLGEVDGCIGDIATICANLTELSSEPQPQVPPAQGIPPSSSTTSQDSVAVALTFSRSRIEYLLERISDEKLEDVQPGSAIPPDRLRLIHDTQVPSVRAIVKECLDRTARYTALPGADIKLIDAAQLQCRQAETWCDQVVTEFRVAQLHLESNVSTKEVTFKKFDPKGQVSIYEFLSLFEEWCHEFVSDAQKPRLLFKYLHPSLTNGYEELKSRKHDYAALKSWLIDNFGSVKTVVDNQLRAIRALKAPKPTDDALTYSIYVRELHRLLLTLYNLEIRRGVHVPQLREFILSHTFLMQIGEVLPAKVKTDWTEVLARQGAILHKIEGEQHLQTILDILRTRYMSYELLAGISPGEPMTPKTITRSMLVERDISPAPSVASSCASCLHDSAHGAGVLPRKQGSNQPTKKPQQTKQTDSNSKTKPQFPPWTCPFKGHTKHLLIECTEFFDTPVKDRQKRSWWACYTCFSLSGACRRGCKNVGSIPKALLCSECESAGPSGGRSVNVLMCGLQNHTKPDETDMNEALEKWIPGFKASKPINVGFTLLMAGASTNPPPLALKPP
jgi:hypothetical protein